MLGAVIGDIAGSPYEGSTGPAKDFPLFGAGARFTDDTVLTIAVADALLHGRPPARSLADWTLRYPGRGYGAGFAAWVRRGAPAPYGSYGNGAAMRVSPAARLARSLDEALVLARRVTEVTHDHPEGLKGAAATVHAIVLAREGAAPGAIRAAIAAAYGYDLARTVDGIRPGHGFDETCQGTVPEALVCALEAASFEEAIRNAVSLGGDTDTLAAIAGPVAEARFGIPEEIAERARTFLPGEMQAVLGALYARG